MKFFPTSLCTLCLLLFLRPIRIEAAAPETIQTIEGLAQGSSYRILYRGPLDPTLPAVIEQRLKEFDQVFSNYRPDSEISRFNADKSLGWFSVSPDLVTLIAYAESISQASEGAFDVTVGPLLQIWGFGPYKRTLKKLPSAQEVERARREVDFHRLVWRKNPPALKKKKASVLVDVSGIAQGYSVDVIAQLLDGKGLAHYMIEIGGEVRTRGNKGIDGPWQIAIDSPSVEPTATSLMVALKDMSLTTAGDYRNYFEKDGQRFSHILDPRTGHPIQHQLAAVTVMAPTALEADGWDTALLVLGQEKARALIKEKDLATYLIRREGQNFIGETSQSFAPFVNSSK